MSQVTFIDKVQTRVIDVPDERKLTADDINELKNAINDNDNNINSLSDSVASLANEVDALPTAGDLTSHTSNTSNPHSVTKAQVGLSNVTNEAQLPLTLTANKDVTGDFNLSLGTSGSHLNKLSVYTEEQLFLHAQADLTINVHASVGTDVVGVSVTPNQLAIAAGFSNSTTVFIRDENSSDGFEVITNDGSIVLTASTGFNITLNADNITLNGNLTNFKDNIIPTGDIDGVNDTYTFPDTPIGLKLYVDSGRLTPTVDYTQTGPVVVILGPPPESQIIGDYRI